MDYEVSKKGSCLKISVRKRTSDDLASAVLYADAEAVEITCLQMSRGREKLRKTLFISSEEADAESCFTQVDAALKTWLFPFSDDADEMLRASIDQFAEMARRVSAERTPLTVGIS